MRALLVLLLLGGCALAPDVGAPLAGACDNTDSNADLDVSFRAQIRPILIRPMAGCTCHLPSAAGATTAIQLSGLDMSSLADLRAGGLHSAGTIVVDSQPCSSILYQKVSQAPPFGSRMPLGGPPFLTSDEIGLIHDWIAEGAADN